MPRLSWAAVCDKFNDLAREGAPVPFEMMLGISGDTLVDGIRVGGKRARLEPGSYVVLALRGRSDEIGVATIRPAETDVMNRHFEVDCLTLQRSAPEFKDALIDVMNGIDLANEQERKLILKRKKVAEQEQAQELERQRLLAAERMAELQREAEEALALEGLIKAETYGEKYGSW